MAWEACPAVPQRLVCCASAYCQCCVCCVLCHAVQYTIILPASKNLPSQVVDFKKGKTQKRKSVGVRYPDEPIAQVCSYQGLQRGGGSTP